MFAKLIVAIIVVLWLPSSGVCEERQETWFRQIESNKLAAESERQRSPEFVGYSVEWLDYSGQRVTLQVPGPTKEIDDGTCITNRRSAGDLDFSKELKEMIQRLRDTNAKCLSILNGVYHFSAEKGSKSHVLFDGLIDVAFFGNNSTFIFNSNVAGIEIKNSRRILVRNLNLRYELPTSSHGKISEGAYTFLLPAKFENIDELAGFGLYSLIEKNLETSWSLKGRRLIIPPHQQESIDIKVHRENGKPIKITFRNPEFNRFNERYVVAKHYWYGGQAIQLSGPRMGNQNEDIQLIDISISTSPGVGVNVESLKRGLLVKNLKIFSEDGRPIGGTAWDGIHITQGGGDVAIVDNSISESGDDAINLSFPVGVVRNVSQDGATVELSNYIFNFLKGDRLHFFDSLGSYLFFRTIQSNIEGVGSGVYRIRLNLPIPEGMHDLYVRNGAFLPYRHYVAGNRISSCFCHGIVSQVPSTMIFNNIFEDLALNPIKLKTDIVKWREGVGAIDTIVKGNLSRNSGGEYADSTESAAISVVGGAKHSSVVNRSVRITGNRMLNYADECIDVRNTLPFEISNNFCQK